MVHQCGNRRTKISKLGLEVGRRYLLCAAVKRVPHGILFPFGNTVIREVRYPLTMQTSDKEFRLALTRQETAKALGVTPMTVDRLVARGLLRPCCAIRRPLFPRAEIERFLRETSAL